MWLEDGTALHDRLGQGYTLLRLGSTRADTTMLEQAVRATGAPLDVLEVPDDAAREIYERDLILVRPDLHVGWRGNGPPEDSRTPAAISTGQCWPNN